MENTYGHYRALGCSKEASYEDLKKAYRKLILQHHPDKMHLQDSTNTDEKFREIEEAWSILRNPEKKRKYDAECRQADLEFQSILIYARITPDEMTLETNSDPETLSYGCRCGSNYLINKKDLPIEKNTIIHISCQECTFVLVLTT